MNAPGMWSASPPAESGRSLSPPKGGNLDWRVIHACEYARDVLPVAEGQVAVGMRPFIVTPHGAGAAELYLSGKEPGPRPALSLVRSWQHVRNWRKSILECDPNTSADLVHAHSFAAGMAAVRSCDCVVYDLRECIDELALASGQCEPGSWMGRSFRAAEQFILSRAAAVIVHSLGMKQAAEERGALPANIFLVPDPLLPEDVIAAESTPLDAGPGQAMVFLAPHLTATGNDKLPPQALLLLEAFTRAAHELPDCRLILEAASRTGPALQQQAIRMGVAGKVSLLDSGDATQAWQTAHVVIALGDCTGDAVASRRPNPICIDALRYGKALLAADVPRNRDVSPDGRGCLWFEPNNARDLGSRMTFLGANPDFRHSLAASGRAYLMETRNHAAVGRKYSEAYRHAVARKKSKSHGSGWTAFYPAAYSA